MADDDTLYDSIVRRVKNHPLGVAAIVLMSVVGMVGWQDIASSARKLVAGGLLVPAAQQIPPQDCYYILLSEYRIPDPPQPVLVDGRRYTFTRFNNHLEGSRIESRAYISVGPFKPLGIMAKSFDQKEYEIVIKYGHDPNFTESGEVAANIALKEILNEKSYKVDFRTSQYFDLEGPGDGGIFVYDLRSVSVNDGRRMAASYGLTFPACEDAAAGITFVEGTPK
jgi:hypothetical protein